MHVPQSTLHGGICPVTLAVGTAAVGMLSYVYYRREDKPTVVAFGVAGAMVFGLQMLELPIAMGLVLHFFGGVLAAAVLGTPFAIIAVTGAMNLQSITFGDASVFAHHGHEPFLMAAAMLFGVFMMMLTTRSVRGVLRTERI